MSKLASFKLSPAGRSTLIIVAFFLGMFGLSSFWLLKEARRISREKELTRAANIRFESDMIWIPAGKFTMGGIGDDVPPDELPLHDVKLDGFWMDKTEVTNAQWEKFVDATGYLTVAERPPNLPGVPPELNKPGSLCFRKPGPEANPNDAYAWWAYVPGASWKSPDGPGSDIRGKEKHPVVHVCYEDAVAYCKWAGKRLPSEAEWEYAARGGLRGQPFIWGNEKSPAGKTMANIWQGRFPEERLNQDGFSETAPVGSFPSNNFGLQDMAGNVWELTEDWYRPDSYALMARDPNRDAHRNPKGPKDSYDPDEPGAQKKVTRGGSWMCSDNYCRGYRPSARMKTAIDTGLQNTGFRCVKDGPAPGA
ncbi:MAG: hypothetical protein JWQ44_2119 [Chthoniobacter sp.]|nr:hypothetical protein [Chthoniobacter sp.]